MKKTRSGGRPTTLSFDTEKSTILGAALQGRIRV